MGRFFKPKTYTSNIPRYVEEKDLVGFLDPEFSYLAKDGTRIRKYKLEVSHASYFEIFC